MPISEVPGKCEEANERIVEVSVKTSNRMGDHSTDTTVSVAPWGRIHWPLTGYQLYLAVTPQVLCFPAINEEAPTESTVITPEAKYSSSVKFMT